MMKEEGSFEPFDEQGASQQIRPCSKPSIGAQESFIDGLGGCHNDSSDYEDA